METHNKKMQSPCSFRAIGVMSGTSLDGLDLSLAHYNYADGGWSFDLLEASTIQYEREIHDSLSNSMNLNGRELMEFDASYGKWIGEKINDFVSNSDCKIDVIGNHGHTVFHNPQKGISTQIGNGAHIAAVTGIPCVSNFRTGDIARNGQGAPLVPIGDELLFSQYDFCLNIGGIANISFKDKSKRVAYDICPANMALNHLSQIQKFPFDTNGVLGKNGKINSSLLDELNGIEFYGQQGPKSLGREWFESTFLTVLNRYNISNFDKLRTCYEHIAFQVANVLNFRSDATVLATGGGSKNEFLIDCIKQKTSNKIIIPEAEIIDFKEAIVFGFLAVLYLLNIPNCLSSVTGANTDSVGGCLYK